MPIERRALRDLIRAEVLRMLESGELSRTEFIREATLAAELNVSRTPLREALMMLEGEGILESEPGRGFRPVVVGPEAIKELCPIIAALEGLALELSPLDDLVALAPELLKRAMSFTQDKAEHGVIESYDDAWHDLLTSACPNGRLLDLITAQRLALHRYERAILPEESMLERSAIEHRDVALSLAEGDVSGAAKHLWTNWMNGMRSLLGDVPDHVTQKPFTANNTNKPASRAKHGPRTERTRKS